MARESITKSDPGNIIADRFQEVREALGLTQTAMADLLLVSQNYIAQLESGRKKKPSAQLLNALETLAAKHTRSIDQPSGKNLSLRTGGEGEVREDAGRYGLADPVGGPSKPMPTPADCITYLQQILAAAADEGSPENIPAIYHRLKKKFPLEEWTHD